MWTQIRKAKKQTPAFTLNLLWNQQVRLSRLDLNVIGLLVALVAYLSVFQPQALAVGGLFSLLAISFRLLQYGVETATGFNIPIRVWHLMSLVLALTVVFGQLGLPAEAQFFNNLEQGLKDVIAGTNSGIDDDTITTIFVFFRILVVLAFVVGVISVFSQAMRGGDWQPIAQLLAIGIAFVIGVEVVTTLILGTTTTANPGTGTP